MLLRKTLLAAFCATTLLPMTAAFAADAQQFPSEQGSITATPIAKGLDHPWAVAFLPDKQGFLVTDALATCVLSARTASFPRH